MNTTQASPPDSHNPSASSSQTPSTVGHERWRPSHRYPCPFENCERLFTCPHNVEQHVREKHTGEKPFVCEICKFRGLRKAFPRPASLNRHMRGIHGAIVETRAGRPPRAVPSPSSGSATPAAGATPETTNNFRSPATTAVSATTPQTSSPMTPPVPAAPPPAIARVPGQLLCEYGCGVVVTSVEQAFAHFHIYHAGGRPYPAGPLDETTAFETSDAAARVQLTSMMADMVAEESIESAPGTYDHSGFDSTMDISGTDLNAEVEELIAQFPSCSPLEGLADGMVQF